MRRKALALSGNRRRPKVVLKPPPIDGDWDEWKAELASRMAPAIRQIAAAVKADPNELWKAGPLLVDFVLPETRGRPAKVTEAVMAEFTNMTERRIPKKVAAERLGLDRETIRRATKRRKSTPRK